MAAVRVWGIAFKKGSSHTRQKVWEGHRYDAACSAALAAAGHGVDGDKLTWEKRVELRQQAVKWLREDLAAWRRLIAKNDKARPAAKRHLDHALQNDPDLETIRDP